MQRNGRIYIRSKLLVVLIARLYVCIIAFAPENVPFSLNVVETGLFYMVEFRDIVIMIDITMIKSKILLFMIILLITNIFE